MLSVYKLNSDGFMPKKSFNFSSLVIKTSKIIKLNVISIFQIFKDFNLRLIVFTTLGHGKIILCLANMSQNCHARCILFTLKILMGVLSFCNEMFICA